MIAKKRKAFHDESIIKLLCIDFLLIDKATDSLNTPVFSLPFIVCLLHCRVIFSSDAAMDTESEHNVVIC